MTTETTANLARAKECGAILPPERYKDSRLLLRMTFAQLDAYTAQAAAAQALQMVSEFGQLQEAMQARDAAERQPMTEAKIINTFRDCGVLRIPTRSLNDPDGKRIMVAIVRTIEAAHGIGTQPGALDV